MRKKYFDNVLLNNGKEGTDFEGIPVISATVSQFILA
jgi:hypothetical protein